MKSTDQTLKYAEILNSYRWRRKENIKMDLQEIGCGHGLDCSGSGYGHVAGFFEHNKETLGSIKCGDLTS